MKIALVHDWLTGMRGGEKCLEVLCELFPEAPIYTLLHNKGTMSSVIESKKIFTSFINNLPSKQKHYRKYLPLFPFAIAQFDLSEYDLVISTSHAVAKNVRVRNDAIHICYCFTPMRYIWDMYEQYFGKGKAGFATRIAMMFIAPILRWWDVRTSSRVTYFIGISEEVRSRIKKHYNRSADMIYPPVDTEQFQLSTTSEDFYLIVSALVPYKRVDLAVNVFNANKKKLIIAGTGPESEKLKSLAKPNITFLGWQSDKELAQLYAQCTALIFPGEEDFGIVPLEAQASGKPVVAFSKGGALETIVDGKTGVFFSEQTVQSLQQAVERLSLIKFNSNDIRQHALGFSRSIFKQKMKDYFEGKVRQHIHKQ
ncbi:MAG: glycosyltransferase [Bacteroidota bacterium]|nr:glycosyltransferase [Bacteroidota bacterium]